MSTHFVTPDRRVPLLTLSFGRSVLLAGIATIALPHAAMAQEAKISNNEETTFVLEAISIDAKADVLTGGVQISEDDLDRIDPADIKDVFRQEPGVTVGSPVGVSQKIYVHGLEDTNLAVDIDGARQANKTYHHIGTTIVDPGLLKTVKIETGVAPADAGPGALAGSISLETKDGRDFVAPDEIFGGFAKVSYNSNTQGISEDLALAGRYDTVDIMAYGTMAGGDNYKDGDGVTVKGTAPEATNTLFKVGMTNTQGYRLKVTANRFADIGVRNGRANFIYTGTTDPQEVEYRRQNYTVSFGDETPTDTLDPKISLSYTKINVDTYKATTVIADTTTLNGKASNTVTMDLGKITAGADFFVDEGTGSRVGTLFTEKASNYGGFAQARLSLSDDLRTSFGARVDHSRLKGNENTKLSNTGLSGNANIEYDFTQEIMGYGGASSVFGGIPLTEVGIQNQAYDYTNLTPFRSRNLKTGVVYENQAFTFDGNVFWTEIDDAPNLTSSTRANSSDINSRGWNLSAKYSYENGFVRGTYSKSKVRVNSVLQGQTSANYTGLSLGDMMTLEVAHHLPEYGVRLGATNEMALRNDEYAQALKGYFVSNVYAEWMPADFEAVSLRFDVKNLFDTTYADRANIAADNTASTISAFNDPGRTVVLTAKYDF